MIEINPMQPADVLQLSLQKSQHAMLPYLTPSYIETLTDHFAWTVKDSHTKQVIACGGIITQDIHRGYVWSLLDQNAGPYLLSLVRAVRFVLSVQPFTRLEAIVDLTFLPGHRLMRLLGFKSEGHLTHFWPDGRDVSLYAKLFVNNLSQQ